MYEWMQRLFSGSSQQPAALPLPAPAPALAPELAPAPPAQRPVVSFEQFDKVNGDYFNWLFDTEGESGLDINPSEAEALAALAAVIGSQQSGAALVRRLPGLLPQLLQSLRSENFSGAQLSRTISNDVVLVAAVIRLANSSARGSGKSISSVEHAVMLIGQQGLRHLITSVAFRPIIDMHSGLYTRTLAPRLWDQAERCAMANRALAESFGVDPFEAFLAGLVHNVGQIVALRLMDQAAKGDERLGSEMFCARLVRDARILTCGIGREWSFPDSVVQAIGEQAGMRKGQSISPLGQLLALTDYLAKVRILVENGRVSEADPFLFDGLPPQAAEGYRALEPIVEAAPAAAPADMP